MKTHESFTPNERKFELLFSFDPGFRELESHVREFTEPAVRCVSEKLLSNMTYADDVMPT